MLVAKERRSHKKEEIILSIGKAIGRPIQVDETTLKREIGYYASVMVEVDLLKEIPDKIWIGTKYGGFYQDIKIPKVPKFCGHCKIVGHIESDCRVSRIDVNKPEEGEIVVVGGKFRKKGKNKDKEDKTLASSADSMNAFNNGNMVVDTSTLVVSEDVGIKLSETFHALKDMEDDESVKELPMEVSKVREIVSSVPSFENSVKGVKDSVSKESLITYSRSVKGESSKNRELKIGKANKHGKVNAQASIITTRKQAAIKALLKDTPSRQEVLFPSPALPLVPSRAKSHNRMEGIGEEEEVATSKTFSEATSSLPCSSEPLPGSIRRVNSKSKATGLFPNGALDLNSKGMSKPLKDSNRISTAGLMESLSLWE